MLRVANLSATEFENLDYADSEAAEIAAALLDIERQEELLSLTSIATMHGKGSQPPKKRILAMFKDTKKKLMGTAPALPNIFDMTENREE